MTQRVHSSTMRLDSDDYARRVVARLLDFFADATSWDRRLWETGTVMALREVCEAGEWMRRQVLHSGAVQWYQHTLKSRLGPDHGLGDKRLRKEVTRLLQSRLEADSQARRRLVELLPQIERGYLRRWHAAVDSDSPPSAESLARTVATHLLDCGHSSDSLHRWVRAMSAREGATLAELLTRACELAEQRDREFEVLVPFHSVPDHRKLAAHLDEWCPPEQAAEWFAANGVKSPPRHNGAFRYTFVVKDAVAAARAAGEVVRRLKGRREYTRRSSSNLEPIGQVWIGGSGESLPLEQPARGLSVPSLERERTVYAVTGTDRLDDALELAAPLDAGAPVPAVSGAWAALEALLYQPGDASNEDGRVLAADRLAIIVACSWPRAELTTLAHRHVRGDDGLSETLEHCQHNLQRSRAVAEHLRAGNSLHLRRQTDLAAEERMRDVLEDPFRRLSSVRDVVTGALRRLYRQRNIVMHGGDPGAVALPTALRTAAPLVGAGLDRIVHARLRDGTPPLHLAARAENALALVGDADGPEVTELLEPPR